MPTPRANLNASEIPQALDKIDAAGFTNLGLDIENCTYGVVAWLPGRLPDGAGGLIDIPAGSIVVPDMSTTIIQIDPSDGTVYEAATLDPRFLGLSRATLNGTTMYVEDIRDVNLVSMPLRFQDLGGTVVEARTDRIRLFGNAIASTVADGLGGVDVKIIGGPGGGGHPTGPLPDPTTCQLFMDANDVGGVADGAGMSSWPDQSPVATDPDNTGGTARPLYHAVDSEDGLPYIEIDGVNDFFRRVGMTEYTGGALTGYLVYRAGKWTGATDGIMSFSKAGAQDQASASRFCFLRNTAYRVTLNRNNAAYEGNSPVQAQAVHYDGAFGWAILAWRWKMMTAGGATTGVLTIMHNSRIMYQDVTFGGALTALGITAFFLGCRHNIGDGSTPDLFTGLDVRLCAYKHTSDSILLMRDTVRYLAPTWGVPLFD